MLCLTISQGRLDLPLYDPNLNPTVFSAKQKKDMVMLILKDALWPVLPCIGSTSLPDEGEGNWE